MLWLLNTLFSHCWPPIIKMMLSGRSRSTVVVLAFALAIAVASSSLDDVFGLYLWTKDVGLHSVFFGSSSSDSAALRMPNFLFAGTQKSGTTALAEHLLKRRDVCGPEQQNSASEASLRAKSTRKEAHFFDQPDKMANGLSSYQSLFAHCKKNSRIIMDATPGYAQLLRLYKFGISTEHVTGVLNVIADFISRPNSF